MLIGKTRSFRTFLTLDFDKLFGLASVTGREEKTKRIALIRISLLTALCGIVQCLIYTILGYPEATLVVLCFVLLSVVNIVYFGFSKNYYAFRRFFLALIIIMPFLSQISLGGFIHGSFIVMASLISPMGALMFHKPRVARQLFFVFVFMVVCSGIIEYFFLSRISILPRHINLAFLSFNTIAVGVCIYFLFEYFLNQKELYMELLLEKNREVQQANMELAMRQEEIGAQNTELRMQQQEIIAQRDEIFRKRLELQSAFSEIQRKNLDITSSINYAKNIQDAMLPALSKVKGIFPESFIYFKPRDIISGDFYWFSKIGNKKIVAAIDCTGHGVPGAFMSLIANTLLNDLVNVRNILEPSFILQGLHQGVVQALQQHKNQNRDGMDISICVFDEQTKELKFAGANNPMYLISEKESLLIAGDRMTLGGASEGRFTTHTFTITEPTSCYLYTDGYPDQFGGPKQKKFLSKRFRELLLDIHQKPFMDQHKWLDTTFHQWKGGGSQIDDVLVIGVKFE
jgi:serine phosphatase RsbU (regulator of sigma subunit)